MVTQGKSMMWITTDEKLTHRQDARPYWVGTNAAQQRLRQEEGKIAVQKKNCDSEKIACRDLSD